jgi:hypothetical protein
MTDHFLTKAKAYAALIGAVLSVLVSQLPDNPDAQKWLGFALAVVTAVATFAIPNKAAAKKKA